MAMSSSENTSIQGLMAMEVSPQSNQLSEGYVKCPDCGAKFVDSDPARKTGLRNLRRHLKSGACQRRLTTPAIPEVLTCDHCGRIYQGKHRSSNFKKHLMQGNCQWNQSKSGQELQNKSQSQETAPTHDTPRTACDKSGLTFQGQPLRLQGHLAEKVCEKAKIAGKSVPEPVSVRDQSKKDFLRIKIVRCAYCKTIENGKESYNHHIETGLCKQRQLQMKLSHQHPPDLPSQGPSGLEKPLSPIKTPRKSQNAPPNPQVTCKTCGRSFAGRRVQAEGSLRRHLARNACQKVLQSGKSSGSRTPPAPPANPPIEQNHKIRVQECELCDARCVKNNTLLKHYRQAHAVAKFYNCPDCKKSCPTEASLRYHRLVSHGRAVEPLQPIILEEEDTSSSSSDSESYSESSSDKGEDDPQRDELRGEEEDAVWENSGPCSPIRIPSPGLVPKVVVSPGENLQNVVENQDTNAQTIHQENTQEASNFFLYMNRYK